MAYPDILHQTDGSVALWIYIVAALVGLLLLFVLVLVLWKCGFFKRNQMKDRTLSANIEKKQSEAPLLRK